MPPKKFVHRQRLFSESIQLIGSIPVITEQLHLYKLLAELTLSTESGICRQLLQKAMLSAIAREDADPFALQRRFVGLAFKFDPGFGAALASLADDDPARRRARSNLASHAKQLRAEQELADLKGAETIAPGQAPEHYSEAAWTLLGKLQARRADPVHMDKIVPYLEIAAELPLQEAYPILAWAIENANQRLERSTKGATQPRSLFVAALLASEFMLHIANRFSGRHRQLPSITVSSPGYHVFQEGDRTIALHFLKQWIAESVGDYLKICDPYFSRDDLELLKIVQQVTPSTRVDILTSIEAQFKDGISDNFERAYRDYWRIRLSDQAPPESMIVMVGIEPDDASPVHDRWWVTRGGGLRMGTSFNSIGLGQISEIREMPPAEAGELEQTIAL